jgi:Uncharacterized protein conserved in bacteria
MQKLVTLANKNKILGLLIRLACFFGLNLISLWNMVCAFLRHIGIGGRKYKGLLKYKGIHDGERCFIICTGPSLTLTDCELLKNEKTFCMNSFCKVYGDTYFRPTYYGLQDRIVYGSMKDELMMHYKDANNVFVADRIVWHSEIGTKWTVFPLNMSYAAYARWFDKKFYAKFSADPYRIVYDGFSITMGLIQIAVYMGFKHIYLLGADCSFPAGEKIHFVESGVVDSTISTARERNLAGYIAAKKYADAHGINIYNATRGGELEVFPRVKLEDVLANKYI